jgi:hypothetical protein
LIVKVIAESIHNVAKVAAAIRNLNIQNIQGHRGGGEGAEEEED